MDSKYDTDTVTELLKRKSKSPSLLGEHDNKRLKLELEDVEKLEDIAKQYKKFLAAPKFNLNSEVLFCICRKPDLEGELMISCDGCEEWFHAKCMKIDPGCMQLLDKFYCKFCQWKGDGLTKWNRKCRLPGCLNPIRKVEKSKYCSDECGEKFLLLKLTGSQALTLGDLSFVVRYCESYEALKSMGSQFPELPEIILLDLSKLPAKVQSLLTDNKQKQKDAKRQHEQCQAKAKYLVRVKEMIAVINEKVQALEVPSTPEDGLTKTKKKKGKSKKIDLCCFQHDLNRDLFSSVSEDAIKDIDVREYFKADIEETVSRYIDETRISESNMCLQDRRKCLRHNGWYNLLSDRVWKRLVELQAALEKLELDKNDTLRAYSIAIYEKEL